MPERQRLPAEDFLFLIVCLLFILHLNCYYLITLLYPVKGISHLFSKKLLSKVASFSSYSCFHKLLIDLPLDATIDSIAIYDIIIVRMGGCKMNRISCLRCQKSFKSQGIYNRLCPSCTEEIKRFGSEFFEYQLCRSPFYGEHSKDLTVPTVAGLCF